MIRHEPVGLSLYNPSLYRHKNFLYQRNERNKVLGHKSSSNFKIGGPRCMTERLGISLKRLRDPAPYFCQNDVSSDLIEELPWSVKGVPVANRDRCHEQKSVVLCCKSMREQYSENTETLSLLISDRRLVYWVSKSAFRRLQLVYCLLIWRDNFRNIPK